MRNTLPRIPATAGKLFAEVWERSRAVRGFVKGSVRECKCDKDGIRPHECRRTILVTKPVNVPALGSALLEPWVNEMVEKQVRQ